MVPPIQSLSLESVDIAIQLANDIFGSLDRCLPISLALLSFDTFNLFLAASQFCHDQVTYPTAFGSILDTVEDEFHATRLVSSILLGKMLAKRFPFVITAPIKSLLM